jgi:hypothetical protein
MVPPHGRDRRREPLAAARSASPDSSLRHRGLSRNERFGSRDAIHVHTQASSMSTLKLSRVSGKGAATAPTTGTRRQSRREF